MQTDEMPKHKVIDQTDHQPMDMEDRTVLNEVKDQTEQEVLYYIVSV